MDTYDVTIQTKVRVRIPQGVNVSPMKSALDALHGWAAPVRADVIYQRIESCEHISESKEEGEL